MTLSKGQNRQPDDAANRGESALSEAVFSRSGVAPRPFEVVTRLLPAVRKLPLVDLELPARKAAFLHHLGSRKPEEFELCLSGLKDWLPKQYQKYFYPVVLEVLSIPDAQRAFKESVNAHSNKDGSFIEFFLTALLTAADSAPDQNARLLRCRGRILATMVWWAPYSVSAHLAKAINSNPRIVCSFAVAIAFAGRSEHQDYLRASKTVCHYLKKSIADVVRQQTGPLDVLLSGGALQLAASLRCDLWSLQNCLSLRDQQEFLSDVYRVSAIKLLVDDFYRWAKPSRPINDPDRTWRVSVAAHVTEKICHSLSSKRLGSTPDVRDLFQSLLSFSFGLSSERGITAARHLLNDYKHNAMTPEQREAALAVIGQQLTHEPDGEFSKHVASPETLRAFLDDPGQMQKLAERGKEAISAEALKSEQEADTSLSAARLYLLDFAQRRPPGMSWWKVLALIDTEARASHFLELWENLPVHHQESLLDEVALLLPVAKDPLDTKKSHEFLHGDEIKNLLAKHHHHSLSSGGPLTAVEVIRPFLSIDARDLTATEKLKSIVADLTKLNPDEDLRVYVRLSQSLPPRDGKIDIEGYRAFSKIFGPSYLPTVYEAFCLLRAEASWGTLSSLNDLYSRRLKLIKDICNDGLRAAPTDRLERELLDHICHFSTNMFGDRDTAIGVMNSWPQVSESRRKVYESALGETAPVGAKQSDRRAQHQAAIRAESAWDSFKKVGPHTVQLALRQSVRRFDISTTFAGELHNRMSDLKNVLDSPYNNFGKMLASRKVFEEVLKQHPIPTNSDPSQTVSWERSLLRAVVDKGMSMSLCGDELNNYRGLVSLQVLRLLSTPPAPNIKSYIRYRGQQYHHADPLDQHNFALLWVDIGAGLNENHLAEEYIFRDVDWDDSRRAQFKKQLRAILPCDDSVKALEAHAAAASSHPVQGNEYERCTLTMIPTRGIARELSGYLFDVCWAGARDVFRSERTEDDGRQNIIGVTFVRDYDTPNAAIVGGCLVVVGYEVSNSQKSKTPGPPVMIVRGCNPRSSFLDTIYVGEFFDSWIDYLSEVARAGKMKLAIPADPVPSIALTNRPDVYYYALQKYFSGESIQVGSVSLTEFNNIRVGDRLRRLETSERCDC